jgi:hypothetical protein
MDYNSIIIISSITWIFLQINPLQVFLVTRKTNKITKHLIKILTCHKCLTLWFGLVYCLFNDINIINAITASFLAYIIDNKL